MIEEEETKEGRGETGLSSVKAELLSSVESEDIVGGCCSLFSGRGPGEEEGVERRVKNQRDIKGRS